MPKQSRGIQNLTQALHFTESEYLIHKETRRLKKNPQILERMFHSKRYYVILSVSQSTPGKQCLNPDEETAFEQLDCHHAQALGVWL